MNSVFPVWRSMLFVPAHAGKFIAKAHERGADAYILDLEDSVPAAEKPTARQMLPSAAAQVSQSGASVLVRVNAPWDITAIDLQAAALPGIAGIVLPKVDGAKIIQDAAARLDILEAERGIAPGQILLIAQIEDVGALPRLDDIATASPRLMGMILGSEDFSASCGMQPIPETLFMPNQSIQFACRRAGILPLGFPGSIADYSDPETFRSTMKRARQMGFVGAFCIHPSQVAIMNEAFSPSALDVADAQGVISAYEAGLSAGRGAVEYQGKMIDLPVVARARELLRRHDAMAKR
jgi:citrate lyase subunit beta/citryl-CoA lyase